MLERRRVLVTRLVAACFAAVWLVALAVAAARAPIAAQWTATPTSVTNLATGVTTNTGNPIQALYSKMNEGQIAELAGGVYPRPKITKSWRQPGIIVTMRGPPWSAPTKAQVKPALAFGGGDTINLAADVGDLRFVRLDIEADDRSAVLSDLKSQHPNVVFDNCKIHGTGTAYDAAWRSDTKWAVLGNWNADWAFYRCDFYSIQGEHFDYEHNNQGDHLFEDCTFKHAGRTALQFLARKFDGPAGAGDFTMRRCTITDVCLEQGGGGSAITCRGGFPNSTLTLEDVVIRAGCDPQLRYHTDSVTGAIVIDEEKTNGVPTVHPGGLKRAVLNRCDIEYGTVFPGTGSAVRPVLRFVGPLQELEIRDTRCVVTRRPTDTPVALEIGAQVASVKFYGTNTFVGQCWYRGQKYATLTALLAAHPELKG